MLRYDRQTKPGLVALYEYDIRPVNGAGPFLQPRSPHGALPGRGNSSRVIRCTVPSVGVGHIDITAEICQLFDHVAASITDCVLHSGHSRLTAYITLQRLAQQPYTQLYKNVRIKIKKKR